MGWWWFIYTIHSTAEGGTKNSRSRGNKTNINNINTKETLPVHIFELKQGGFRCAAYAHCLASWPLVAVVSVGKSPPRKRGRRLHVRPGAGYRIARRSAGCRGSARHGAAPVRPRRSSNDSIASRMAIPMSTAPRPRKAHCHQESRVWLNQMAQAAMSGTKASGCRAPSATRSPADVAIITIIATVGAMHRPYV